MNNQSLAATLRSHADFVESIAGSEVTSVAAEELATRMRAAASALEPPPELAELVADLRVHNRRCADPTAGVVADKMRALVLRKIALLRPLTFAEVMHMIAPLMPAESSSFWEDST